MHTNQEKDIACAMSPVLCAADWLDVLFPPLFPSFLFGFPRERGIHAEHVTSLDCVLCEFRGERGAPPTAHVVILELQATVVAVIRTEPTTAITAVEFRPGTASTTELISFEGKVYHPADTPIDHLTLRGAAV